MRAIAVLEEIGHRGFLPEAERGLAGALVELGDIPEAEAHALRAVELTLPDDWFTVASTKLALGRARDGQGRDHEAKALLEEAIAAIDRTDYRTERWPFYLALAEFYLRRQFGGGGRRLARSLHVGQRGPVERSAKARRGLTAAVFIAACSRLNGYLTISKLFRRIKVI